MSAKHLDQLAREKAGQGPDWDVYRYESFPRGVGPRQFMQLTGAVAPRFTKGPRKGWRNWKKKDAATERAIIVTDAEVDAYEAKWERDTGLCADCEGAGQMPYSWSRAEGQKFSPCRKCKGSGKAPAVTGGSS